MIKKVTAAMPFVILFATLLYIIYPNLNNMLLPVIVYGIAISTFGTLALLNYYQKKSKENEWIHSNLWRNCGAKQG